MSANSAKEVPAPRAAMAGGGDLPLPRPPGVVWRFWSRHPHLADVGLALFWGGLPVLAAPVAGTDGVIGRPEGIALSLLLIVAATASLFLRRRWPLLALVVSWLALPVIVFSTDVLVGGLALFAVYSVGAQRSARAAWPAGAATWVLVMLIEAVAGSTYGPGANALPLAFVLFVAVLIGITVGNRRRYLVALLDRAERLAREREQQARLAAAEERARIARDMHDVVSHGLTVMVTLAEGSAALAPRDPERAADAMRDVAETGRAALTDMRRMLGVLGGGEEALAPQPGLADLPALVERFRSLGLPIAATLDPGECSDLSVQLAVYRVVQEALTNALRYSHGPTQVAVRVERHGGTLAVAVVDDGLPGFPATRIGAGQGLNGLVERIAALGGRVEHGPEPTGGWQVTAAIPVPEEDA